MGRKRIVNKKIKVNLRLRLSDIKELLKLGTLQEQIEKAVKEYLSKQEKS